MKVIVDGAEYVITLEKISKVLFFKNGECVVEYENGLNRVINIEDLRSIHKD